MSVRLERRTIAKAASYTVKPPLDSPGTVFTTAGATGAITFTLPTPGPGTRGWWYRFKNLVDQNMIVAAGVADTLICFNDLTADSLAASTSGEKIGAEIEVECVETTPGTFRWTASGVAVAHTYTVAT